METWLFGVTATVPWPLQELREVQLSGWSSISNGNINCRQLLAMVNTNYLSIKLCTYYSLSYTLKHLKYVMLLPVTKESVPLLQSLYFY